MLKHQNGFTLVELLVVVVILGILASVAVPNFAGMQDKAKNSAVQACAHSVQIAVEQYSVDNNNMFTPSLSQSVMVPGAGYVNDDIYPLTPWATQQARASDILWTDKASAVLEGAGVLLAPTAITHYGALSFRCVNGLTPNDRYDIGGTGKKGDMAQRAVNLRNY